MDDERPDPEEVLGPLKDFQERTARYAFQRLYQDPDSTHRFLVADEVGLGKTLVARGTIALAADHLWDDIDRIDVVYICSNSDIARQNIRRLTLDEDANHAFSSRLTLLPRYADKLRQNKLNFVSFTPGTSLDLKSSLGRMKERVLLYHLLEDAWDLHGKAPLNVLQGHASAGRFRRAVRNFEDTIDSQIRTDYIQALEQHPDLQQTFHDLCDHYPRHDSRVSSTVGRKRAQLVGELRTILAETCVDALEPDLIILDEFQRFRHILDEEDEDSQLARLLFNYSDEHTDARVLLLSATPYKMYTTHQDSEEDHYEDFLATLDFLATPENRSRIEDLLREYRRGLYRVDDYDIETLTSIQQELETRLPRVMARTERLAASSDREGMLKERGSREPALEPQDVQAYVETQQISRQVGGRNILRYWKSAPYLLNFMDGYVLKDEFTDALESPKQAPSLAASLTDADSTLLEWDDVETYDLVDPQNARLRYLWNDVIDSDLWRLLWIPPSLPYHGFGPPYDDPALQDATKRLIFSSWRIVPKVVAGLTSYEVERRITQAAHEEPLYETEDRQNRGYLLDLSQSEDRLTGMPLFTLLYPSHTLAQEVDPLEIARSATGEDDEGYPSLAQALNHAESKIEGLLEPVLERERRGQLPSEGQEGEDQRWYWAAPVLLDLHHHAGLTHRWLQTDGLPDSWIPEESQSGGSHAHWDAHVDNLRELQDGLSLGEPPSDLPEVLALVALGGPATCALRALSATAADQRTLDSPRVRMAAAQIGWAFRSLFNLPETTALIRGIDAAEPYWRRTLEYSVHGNMQALLDEYAHTLFDVGYQGADPEDAAEEIAHTMVEAVSLRTVNTFVDDIEPAEDQVTLDSHGLRTRFALRFGDAPSADIDEQTRADEVRLAFNSPFWPFVLVSTSVGQEGLDFHPYCHAVVHWNLPSNPVDLEQREGRVHRFKGHAIRKNLSHDYHPAAFESQAADPWNAMFNTADKDPDTESTDMVPYWIYRSNNRASIERHLPHLPYTKDKQKIEALRKSLTLYRMAFGQPRQEDLVRFLSDHLDEDDVDRVVGNLQINLEPPKDTKGKRPDTTREP